MKIAASEALEFCRHRRQRLQRCARAEARRGNGEHVEVFIGEHAHLAQARPAQRRMRPRREFLEVERLTLTPALAALLMRAEAEPRFPFFRAFDAGLAKLTEIYGRFLHQAVRLRYVVAAVLGGLPVLTYVLFTVAPTGFLPDEDQGASSARSKRRMARLST